MTTYEQFEEAFNNSSLQNEYLVYDDQFREFLDDARFDDLLAGSSVVHDCFFNSVNCNSAIRIEGNVDRCVYENITKNTVKVS
jgi:hypothetical protein